MPKIKLKPKSKKSSSQWEIIEENDIPMAQNGKMLDLFYSKENENEKLLPQKQWLENWINHPEYEKRLTNNLKEINDSKSFMVKYIPYSFPFTFGEDYWKEKAAQTKQDALKRLSKVKDFYAEGYDKNINLAAKYAKSIFPNEPEEAKYEALSLLYGSRGEYKPFTHSLFVNSSDATPSTGVHEYTHSTGMDSFLRPIIPQAKKVTEEYKRLEKENPGFNIDYDMLGNPMMSNYQNKGFFEKTKYIPSDSLKLNIPLSDIKYLNKSNEVYPRIMELRYNGQIKPGQIIDKKSFENIKKQSKNNQIFDMYSDEEIIEMMNKLAQNTENLELNKAEYGKSVKFQNGGKYPLVKEGGYDIKRALELGYEPDETGHMPSRDYETGQYLKAKNYQTTPLSILYDELLGYKVRQDLNGNLYSIPKEQQYPNFDLNNPPVRTFQNGGNTGYQWSNQQTPSNYTLATPKDVNVSRTESNRKLTAKEVEQLKKYTEEQNQLKKEQEYQQRKEAIKQSIKAQNQPLTIDNLRTQTQATGDKMSFAMNSRFGNPKEYPTLSGYMDALDFINPGKFIGDMATGLGALPYNVREGNYGQAALSLAAPLATGALAGIGANSTKQFVNNLANPLAGTKDLMNNLGNKYLPNAYKLNPWQKQFNNPDAFYRQVDDLTFKEGLESGLIKGKQNVDKTRGENIINLNKSFGDDAYYKKGSLYSPQRADYIYEVNKTEDFFIPKVNNRTKGYTTENTPIRVSKTPIPINEANIYKKDWLRGYKEMPKPASNFQSEIDWSKWNPDTPKYPELINEYNAIEKSTKKAGTWMKNPDGSKFKGTPEQFIQQQSSWFKKAFPEGFENVFRGVQDKNVVKELNPERSMFTADFDLASNYTRNKEILTPFDQFNTLDKSQFNPNVKEGMFNLAHKKSLKSIELDNFGKEWTSIDLTNPKQSISNIELNIKHLEKQLERQKEFLKSGKQNLDGSWSFPDTDIVYSNQLYKEGTKGQEKIINSYKDRLKNINNLVKNEKELEKMKSVLGNKTTTDDIAKYIEDSNLDYVKIKNVDDSGLGDVSIVNHKKGNYLKSLVGNVGFFDMTNPNIYKAIIPPAAIIGASQIEQKQSGGKIKTDPKGYWNKDNHGKPVRIPSNRITMKGVNQPLMGISDAGDIQYMEPNGEYLFDGSSVLELPLMQKGGRTPIKGTKEQYQAYQDSLYNYNWGINSVNEVKKNNPGIVGKPFYGMNDDKTLWGIAGGKDEIPINVMQFLGRNIKDGSGHNTLSELNIAQFQQPVQPIIYKPGEKKNQSEIEGIDGRTGTATEIRNGRKYVFVDDKTTPWANEWIPVKEQPIKIQSSRPDLLQGNNQQLEFNPVGFQKGSYFTRDAQQQEVGGKEYFDKTTGKKLKKFGGKVKSKWSIIED